MEPEVDENLHEFIDEVPYAFQNEELMRSPLADEIVEIDFDALKTAP
jgi:hypothetical protein